MASPSRLAFALDGSWKHLRGAIAIDRSVADLGLEGSVRFKLLFDGQPRYESQEVRRSDGLLPLPELDLTGVLRLELVTEMASDLFEGDRADWIDLRLVR